MELTEPRKKKNFRAPPKIPLQLKFNRNNEVCQFKGFFNGYSIEINDKEDMKDIILMGCFGKGNLSRSFPRFSQKNKDEIVRERQFNQRKRWKEENKKNSIQKVIVVPDSESETEEYFTNLKPRYEIDNSGLSESLHLGLEESFYLCNALKCLNIYYQEKLLDSTNAWKLFLEADPYFEENYIAYYYYRSKNWIVKPGIKFGTDFLLYKDGPQYYHASYAVILDVLDENLQRKSENHRRLMDIINLLSLNRLCETAGKELLICQIIWPKNLDTVDFENFNVFKIKETTLKRWISSQQRQPDAAL